MGRTRPGGPRICLKQPLRRAPPDTSARRLLNMLEIKPSPIPAFGGTSPQAGKTDLPNKVRVLSLLVEDGQNTLTKVSGVLRRRGFHVRGISVGPSRQPGRSRITLEIDHGHAEADQVRKQLERLVEVLEVEDLT